MNDVNERIYMDEVRVLAEAGIPFTAEFLRGIGEPIGCGLWEEGGMEANAFFIVSRLWAGQAIRHAVDQGWIKPLDANPEIFVGLLTKEEDPPGPPRARPPAP